MVLSPFWCLNIFEEARYILLLCRFCSLSINTPNLWVLTGGKVSKVHTRTLRWTVKYRLRRSGLGWAYSPAISLGRKLSWFSDAFEQEKVISLSFSACFGIWNSDIFSYQNLNQNILFAISKCRYMILTGITKILGLLSSQ